MIEIGTLWANEEILQDKKVVLFLPLRELDIDKINSIKDMFNHVCKGRENALICKKYFMNNNGQGLVILLDGLDENLEAMHKETFLYKTLIKDNVFSKACIIVTSRPHATVELQKCVSYRVEILGFTDDKRRQFVEENLKENPNDLKDYLQKHPTIDTLCYIPLNMSILLFLFHEKQRLGDDYPLPDTQTELIKQAITMTILRNLEKLEVPELQEDLKNLPYLYNKIFRYLCMLAYDALNNNKLIFTKKDIEIACPVKGNGSTQKAVIDGLGLLQTARFFADARSTTDSLSNFAHFSIQEFLAAWHFTFSYCFRPLLLVCKCLRSSSQLKVLKAKFWKGDYMNMWSFYVGLTRGEDVAFKHFLSGTKMPCYCMQCKSFSISKDILNDKIKTLHLYYFLQEAPDNEMIQDLNVVVTQDQLDVSGEILNLKETKTNLELLGYILSRPYLTNQWDRVILSSCKIDDESFEVLHSILTRNEKSPRIKALSLSDNELNSCSDIIVNLVCSHKIYHLNVSNNVLKDMNSFQNCAGFLETLMISNNQLDDEKALKLFEVLKYFGKLKVLSLNNNNIGADQKLIDALGLALCCCNCLENLEIYGNMIEDEALLIFDVINDIRNSRSNVYYYRLSDKAFAFLKILGYCDQTDDEPNLCVFRNKIIETVGVNISYNGIKADAGCLGQHLHLLVNLKRLNIAKNNISDGATKSLTLGMFLTPNLEEFKCDKNMFSETSIMIFKMIHNLRTTINKLFKCEPSEIKALLFILNCINDNVEELQSSDIVSIISDVTELNLSHNEPTTLDYKLTSDDLKELCKVLTCFKKLKVLDVRNNDITDEAKESMVKKMLQMNTLNSLKLDGNPIFDNKLVFDTIINLRERRLQSISCNRKSSSHEESYCIIYIMECLNSLKEMNCLNIFGNITTLDVDLELEFAGKFFEYLNYLSGLSNFKINNVTCITDCGMKQLSKYLTQSITLTTLDLSFCNLGNLKIQNGAQINNSLKLLKCNYSKLTDELLRNFMLMFRKVDHLEIEGNCLGDKGISTLHSVLLSYENDQQTLDLHLMVNLKILNIANNNISDKSTRILTIEMLLAAKLEEFKYNENLFSENSIMIFEIICKLRTTIDKSFKCEPSKIKALLFILNCIDNVEELQSSDIVSIISGVTELNLSHNEPTTLDYKLTSEDLKELCALLTWFKRLEVLDVRNNGITDEPKEAMVKAVLQMNTLNDLKLIGNPIFHNMLVFDTIIKLREGQVQSITYNQNSSSHEHEEGYCVIYIIVCLNLLENMNCRNIFGNITTLDVDSESEFAGKIFECLNYLLFLREMTINNVTCITDYGMNQLGKYLTQNVMLTTLDLSFCNLKNLEIKNVAEINNSLKLLKCNYSKLTDELLRNFMLMFRNVDHLEIEGNCLGDKGISTLHSTLLNCKNDQLGTTIITLNLANNQLTLSSAAKIIELVQICKVKKLNISDNFLQRIFCNFEKFKITTLEELNISGNNHQTVSTLQFAKNISYLKSCNSLKRLNISNNSIDETAIDEIYYSFMKCSHIEEVMCNGNPAENEIEVAFYFVQNLQTNTCSKNTFICPPLKIKALIHLLRCINDNEERLQSSDMVSRLSFVTELNLSHTEPTTVTLDYKLTSEDIKELCKVLTWLKHLKVLDVRNNEITDEAKESLAKVMLQISTLNSVKLIGNPIFDDELSMVVFDTIKNVREKQVESITDDQNSSPHIQCYCVIWKCLNQLENPNCFKSFDNITTLDIDSESDHAGKVFEYLNYLPFLKTLKINNVTCITDHGMKQLSKYLAQNITLTTLDLSSCNLENLDVENGHGNSIPLKVLKLNHSNISGKALYKLSLHMLMFTSLNQFEIKGNYLGDKGVSNLYNAKIISQVRSIDFSCNKMRIDETFICVLQTCTQVEFLNLENNDITNDTFKYLATGFLFTSKLMLKNLNLNGNPCMIGNSKNKSVLKMIETLRSTTDKSNFDCTPAKFEFFLTILELVDSVHGKPNEIAGTISLIKTLNLSHSELTDSLNQHTSQLQSCDIKIFCHYLSCFKSLESINMTSNNIRGDVRDDLVIAVLRNYSITKILLEGNPIHKITKCRKLFETIGKLRRWGNTCTFTDTPLILEALVNILQYINDFDDKTCDITNNIEHLDISSYYQPKHSPRYGIDKIDNPEKLTKGLIHHLTLFCKLKTLNLHNAYLTPDSLKELSRFLCNNKTLQKLDISNNNIPAEGALIILRSLDTNTSLKN